MTAGDDYCQSGGGLRTLARPRRVAFMCMKLAALVMLLAVVAVGALYVRINVAPVNINGLGQTIVKALQDRFGNGLKFAFGDTSIVQHGFGTVLAVEKLTVTGPQGQVILSAPRGELAVSTVALLFGKVVPKRLEVFDVTLRAMLLKNGNLAIAAGNGAPPFFEIGRDDAIPTSASVPDVVSTARASGSAAHDAEVMLRRVADVLSDPVSPIAAVNKLGITHGTLVIEDETTGAETTYRDLDLSLGTRRGTTTLDVAAAGPTRRWSIEAAASGTLGHDRRFSVRGHDLTIDDLKMALGSRGRDIDTDAPIAFHLDVGLRSDNTLTDTKGGVEIGTGYVLTDDPDFEPLFITSLGAELHWDSAMQRTVIDDLHYQEGETHLAGAGDLVSPATAGSPWQLKIGLREPGLFAPDRKGQQSIAIVGGDLSARIFPDRKLFQIDRMTLRPQGGGFALAGSLEWENGRHLRLGISMDPTPVQVVERIWPSMMAASVRAWVLNHFDAGLISNGVLKIDYDDLDLKRMRADAAPADKSLQIDFDVTGGRVAYLDGVPPLENVAGTAHITGRTTTLDIKSATSSADGGTIDLKGGRFFIPNSSVHPVQAFASAHLAGQVETVAAVLSRDALKPYVSLPLDPTTLHGTIEGDLAKGILLGPGPAEPDKEGLAVNAAITNFTADHLIGKESLENANLQLAVANSSFQATGQGKALGGPASFTIIQQGSALPHADIDLVIDDAARDKLGLSALPGLTGPINAHVSTDLGGDPAQMKALINLDLAKTGVAAAYLGLTKPAGRPAKIALTLSSTPDHMVIDPIAVDIGTLQAKGSIELAGDNSFRSARFSTFKVSAGDDMKLDVLKADDVFKLIIRGGSIDARPFLKAVTSTPTNEATALSRSARAEKKEADSFKGFDVDLHSSLLTGFNKEVLSGAELKLSKRGADVRQFSLQGHFGRNNVSGTMAGGGRVKIVAQDAGALVSFIDLYKHMEGGNLAATMQLGDDTLSGNLEIRDFILRDEPAIARLVATSTSLAAPGQDAEAARRINAGAVGFNRLKVNFQRDGSHLQLSDATMYGPDIGLSVDGWLDYSHDRVGMKGTFVPAYALNNLFSQIPVIGLFLGGKSNEGLLAITFNISGQASQPSLNINPLSVIAPGFLRNIFGVLDAPAPVFPGPSAQPSR